MVKFMEVYNAVETQCVVVVHDNNVSEKARRAHGWDFRETGRTVEKRLRNAGVKGRFQLRPRNHVTMRSNERWRIHAHANGLIRITSRPKANESCWEYDLTLPDGCNREHVIDVLMPLTGCKDLKTRDIPLIPPDIIATPEPEVSTPQPTQPTAIDEITKLLMSVTSAKQRQASRVAEIEEKRKQVAMWKTDIQSLTDKLKAAQDRIAEIELEAEQDVEGRKALQLAETLTQLTKTNGIH